MVKKFIRKTKFKKEISKSRSEVFLKEKHNKSFKKRRGKNLFKLINFLNFNFNTNILKYLYIWVFVILILWIAAALFSPLLNIKNINIIRTDDITNMNIAYKSVNNFRWKHLLFVDTTKIEDSIRNYQKNIKDIKINTKLFNSIDITIWSYPALFKTNVNGKTYLITENGIFIPWDDETLKEINIISNENFSSMPDYKEILNANYVKSIQKLHESLKDNLIVIWIKDIDYYVKEREAIITINNDSKIIFDLDWDIMNQIKNLIIFNKEHLDISKNSVVYIDLRIKNKIYFCPMSEEFQCKINLKKIYWIKGE